jgi:acyl-CoA reductase-like NAD-dependent aldehyde dehydrogenase
MSSSATTAGVRTYQNFVNGKWESAASGKTFPVYDPSTEEVIAHVAAADAADVDRAVKAARAAFDSGSWPQTTAQDRGRILFKLAEKIRQNSAALAELECRNTGKPIVEAEYDIADVATCFEYYGGLANKVTGHVNPVPANALSFTMREPVGVAGQIIPWNYPLLMAAWKLAPAIAAGCCCVLKPAEQTPLTALEFANYFEEAGLPPGVVNIVNGFGETAGVALVAHPGVDKIAFTGSAAVQTPSSVSLSSSAANPPTFSLPMPTGKPPSTALFSASSSIKAKFAPPAAASLSKKRSTPNLSKR